MATVTDISDKMRSIRSERYAMQSVARKALPDERVSKCLRMVNNKHQVEVWKHRKTDRAFYGGLTVCGSVWHCPVCASKISERRKLELQQAFDLYKAQKGNLAFLTLTFSHTKFDSLQEILDKFTEASRKYKSGRQYQRIKEKMGIEGSVRGLEVTHSELNGFHPHSHEVIFYKNDCELELIKKELWLLWEKACNKVGLKASEEHGLTLQTGDDANDYLTKFGKGNWTLEQEMTKAHIKKGKNEKSLTPFDFLKWYLMTEDNKYLRLFKEYAIAFKGKRQLYWSKGLKARFAIGEKTDEELSKEKLEEADLLGLLTYDQWKVILKKDTRSQLLDAIEKYGFEFAVKFYLEKEKESSRNEDSLKC